ncbi:PUA-like domain-containing protein [Mycena sanguinolenta]|nr:PUA-like domain-containing protein [Mycena sanguinolenta]
MVRQDPKVHGDLTDLPVGLMFADREDVFKSGIHGHPLAGIFGTKGDGGAFSIVLNEGYEDDEDTGETIIYTGEGKGKPAEGEAKPGNQQQGHQDMNSNGNAALKKNVETKRPVRVIRGSYGNVKYSPMQGYRYDGLYDVEEAYVEEGKAGFKMCKFKLSRATVPLQDSLPTHITGKGPSDLFWSPDGRETLAVPKLNNPAPQASTGLPRTIEQKRREITGKQRLPAISFKKKNST